jgi:hypothetical protein
MIINLKNVIMEEKKNSDSKKSEVCWRKGYRSAVYPVIMVIILGFLMAACDKDQFDDGMGNDIPQMAGIANTYPMNLSKDVYLDDAISVTFKNGTDQSVVESARITLSDGSGQVSGSMKSSGMKKSFTAYSDLKPDNEYEAKASFDDHKKEGKHFEYSWKFRTGKHHGYNSVDIVSVSPADKSVDAPVTASLTITFNKDLTDVLKGMISVTLAQGTLNIGGALSFAGKTATFKPSAALTEGTLYTGKVVIGSNTSGGAAKTFIWTFTTAGSGNNGGGGNTDTTKPSVTSATPANNSMSVDLASSLTAMFSEAMDPTSITASTFTLKQGNTSISGSVTYAGTTATLKPAAALTGGTVYTATISTGAKDVAGNALAANYTWSFTTLVEVAPGLSFANDVIPVLKLCNNCHTHPWTTSSVASTYYTNLVNAGYVNPSNPTSGKIYTKLAGGHPGSSISTADKDKVMNWITEGSKNN